MARLSNRYWMRPATRSKTPPTISSGSPASWLTRRCRNGSRPAKPGWDQRTIPDAETAAPLLQRGTQRTLRLLWWL